VDWTAIRREFPALERWTYLNTATYGQVPRRALDAVQRHWRRRAELASADFLDWYTDADSLRGSVARLIHARPGDIAFVPNAAAALSLVLAGLEIPSGAHVLTLEDEFPNYQYIPCVRKTPWERFCESIGGRTALVAVSEVNYSTGFRPPLAEIVRVTRERGVPLFVDGSQSVGALRFDVRATPVDVLAVHGYKWLCSPTGAGFMYVAPEFRRRLRPAVVGWRSHRDWRNVDRLHYGRPEFQTSAERYEGGGLPFDLLYAMQASVDWMLEIGPAAIEARVLELAAAVRAMLCGLGAAVQETGSHIVTAALPGGADASEVARRLRDQRVLVAARHGRLRVSPHFYNHAEDVARLGEALQSCLK
jgi:cysteine desulfurase/selenocysteine lyase